MGFASFKFHLRSGEISTDHDLQSYFSLKTTQISRVNLFWGKYHADLCGLQAYSNDTLILSIGSNDKQTSERHEVSLKQNERVVGVSSHCNKDAVHYDFQLVIAGIN